MAKPTPVCFGKLQLSWQILQSYDTPENKRFLARQLTRLTPSEIGHGLMHSSGKQLLQKACELAGIDFEELRCGV